MQRNTETNEILEYLQPLTTHPLATQLMTTSVSTHLSALRADYLNPYVIEPFSRLLVTINSSEIQMPDLLSILILAVILLISLKILDYTRRMVMFWVRLAVKLVFWGLVLGVVWYGYTVGVERLGKEVGMCIGWVVGVVEDFQRGVDLGRS